MPQTGDQLLTLLERLAVSVVRSQEGFDSAHQLAVAALLRDVAAGGASVPGPLVASLVPARTRIQEQAVTVNVRYVAEHSIEGDVAIRLGAVPVHSFFEARYAISQGRGNSITMKVAAMPMPAELRKPDQKHLPST